MCSFVQKTCLQICRQLSLSGYAIPGEGRTVRGSKIERLTNCHCTMFPNYRTNAIDVSRDPRALNTSSSLKITLSINTTKVQRGLMKEMGLVISLEGTREGGLVVKTEWKY